jgi:carboxymethylenebutenolidase
VRAPAGAATTVGGIPRGAVERLTAADGFTFDAWREPAREARRGGLVIAHAIWGVTPHLRSLASEFAEAGWEVAIPSLFDRFRPDSPGHGLPEQNITPAEFDLRMGWAQATDWSVACLPDIAAAIASLQGPTAMLGFCFGGTATWLAACRLDGLSAAVAFYGGHIFEHRHEQPRCPTLLHFGRDDGMIPPEQVEAIRDAFPDMPVHLYPAGHGFVAPTEAHHRESAELALLRTRAFLHRALGGRGDSAA